MAKSDKLYDRSPRLERGEDGNMGVKRPDKATDISTGINEPVHTEQVSDMHDRHQMELRDMHKRHLKEMTKVYTRKDGAEMLDRVEKTEKE